MCADVTSVLGFDAAVWWRQLEFFGDPPMWSFS